MLSPANFSSTKNAASLVVVVEAMVLVAVAAVVEIAVAAAVAPFSPGVSLLAPEIGRAHV